MATEDVQGLRRGRGAGLALWLALAVAWFATAPLRPFLDPDEGRYAEIPREMLVLGDWITPHLDGLKYFEKPPLQYWGTAVAYSLFGVNEWSARLWSVGLGFLCLPLTYAWTRRLYGQQAGCAAVLALALSPYFELVAHLNLLDAGFSFWLVGAVLAFCLGQCAPVASTAERRWMLVAWVGAAAAVLSKGIVVGVLTGGALIVYTVLERDWRPWRRLHIALGVPLFLLLSAPWFVAVTARNPSFPQFFFIHEHFARFLTTVHQRVEPWWFFGAILLIGVLPWALALPAAARAAWCEMESDKKFKPLKFLLIFSIVTLLFFSVSDSKLAPYILPMMPPLAAVVGVHVAGRPRFVRITAQFAAILIALLAGGLLMYASRRYGEVPHVAMLWLAAGVLVALLGAAATWRGSVPNSARGAWVVVASAMLAWQSLLSAFAELPERSSHRLVLAVRPLIQTDTELFSIGQYRETLSPYLGRTLTLVDFQGELAFGIEQEPAGELSRAAFLARWNAARSAVAFISPRILDEWRQLGLQGRVIGADHDTVVISRT